MSPIYIALLAVASLPFLIAFALGIWNRAAAHHRRRRLPMALLVLALCGCSSAPVSGSGGSVAMTASCHADTTAVLNCVDPAEPYFCPLGATMSGCAGSTVNPSYVCCPNGSDGGK